MMSNYPKRIEGVEVNKMEDGYVIFHSSLDDLLFLNHTAAIVMELCDGETDISEIYAIVKDVFKLENAPKVEIDTCLKDFEDACLITY